MKYLAAILLAFGLGACATPSIPGAMVPSLVESNIIEEDSTLYQSVAVGDVSGGKKTNPLWVSKVATDDFAEALRQTLSAHAMLATDTNDYSLDAELVSLKQPFGGLNMKVTSVVSYTLTDVSTDEVVFQTQVEMPYTAKMGDAFVGSERLKLANEGSIKANLAAMITELTASVGQSADGVDVAEAEDAAPVS